MSLSSLSPGAPTGRSGPPIKKKSVGLVIALAFLALVFDGYDLVVYGTIVDSILAYEKWGLTTAETGAMNSLALLGMALGSYHWQRYTDAALLDFVLGVMAFAYSGLLGVYGIALFTRRGSSGSVIAAFVAGFLTVLAFQPYVIDSLALPEALRGIAFPWQLVAGTLVAAAVCAMASGKGVARSGATR